MKNNKLKYVVLAAVVGIWVAVGKMIFFDGEEEALSYHQTTPLVQKTEQEVIDSYELHGDYKDPFLSKLVRKRKIQHTSRPSISSKRKSPIKQVKKEKQSTITWPEVAYLGVIQHSASKKQMHILRVNNQEELIIQGQDLNGVSLLQLNKDSVLVGYKGEKKKIGKATG